MNASQKFSSMGSNLSKMLFLVTSNQNFLRYIKYLDNTPLDPVKANVTEDDIPNQIILTLFDATVLEDTEIKVFFHPLDGTLDERPLGADIFIMDIVIPNAFWHLHDQGEFRAFQMAHEVAKKIDGQNIAGIGQVEIMKWRTYPVQSSYHGLTLWIKVNSPTMKR